MTIASIAHRCGFADLYHFSHRFTRACGMSPRAFRAGESAGSSVLLDPGVRRLANAMWD